MNTLKKSTVLAVTFGYLLIVSSRNRLPCPTYSKADIQKTEVKA